MNITRLIVVLAASMFLLAAPLAAQVEPPDWVSIGAEDATITRLIDDEWKWHLTFLATPDGYRYYHHQGSTGTWTIHEEPGTPGREVTALTSVPRLDHRLLTGRLGADGHGVIELDFPLLRDQVVHISRAGAVADLTTGGYYDPVIFACTRALDGVAGELMASADTGQTWQEITGHGHHDLTDLQVWSPIEFHVAGDAGIMFTEDGGQTWQSRNEGLPAGPVHRLWDEGPPIAVPDKIDDGGEREWIWHLFAVMDDGVWFTPTAELDWHRVYDAPARQVRVKYDPWGLPHVLIVTGDGRLLHGRYDVWEWTDISGSLAGLDIVGVIARGPGLLAATVADGVYTAPFFGGATDVPPADPVLQLVAAPNPFNPGTTLRFVAPASGHARLTVHDLRGRHVATLLDDEVAAGPVERIWQPRDLASGVYLARLELGGRTTTQRVALVR